MELILRRSNLNAVCTEGDLFLHGSGDNLAFTLELPVKDGLPGSAIPPGTYLVKLLPSPKFQQSTDPWVKTYTEKIPHVLGIPNRSDILIHWGNEVADTEGCILVGMTQGTDFIGSSRPAFAALWQKLMAAETAGEAISLQVIGGIPQVPNNHDAVQENTAE
jgi:hypothetical protein